eukprot:scaffold120386_cov18-Prasinocladus_malaysianus.AAC.1
MTIAYIANTGRKHTNHQPYCCVTQFCCTATCQRRSQSSNSDNPTSAISDNYCCVISIQLMFEVLASPCRGFPHPALAGEIGVALSRPSNKARLSRARPHCCA